MWKPFVNQSVKRPQFLWLKKGYEDYRTDSRPCKRGAENQCAVRMSLALERAGCTCIRSFPKLERVHSGDGPCLTGGLSHVLGALELADYLVSVLGNPVQIFEAKKGGGCAQAFKEFEGRTGILYFNNCFTRKGETKKVGDHIDLFDGKNYYNDIIKPKAGGDETTGGSLFGRSDRVRFWAIS